MRRHYRIFLLIVLAAIATCGSPSPVEDEARKAAVHRKRNLIFNNDGDDALHYGKFLDAPTSKEGFLSIRMDHIGESGIDSVFYCTTQSFNSFTHDSELTEVFKRSDGFFDGNRTGEMLQMGIDPLATAIESCRKRNIEIFWSLRMNDIHDNFYDELLSQWKMDHPEMLMGRGEDKDTYPPSDPRHIWTFVDFAHQEVRDLTVTIVRDVLNRYDVDGIDLDFLRHPAFFKETRLFQPATQEHTDMLTDMVTKIRQEVLAASERKSKPILLSVRVLPTLRLNRLFGFAVEQWVEQNHVDFIILGGGYDPFTMPVKEMIDRGHEWGIPVYVCLSHSGFGSAARDVEDSQVGNTPECWRAAAANAWYAGADGIMTFNLFPKSPGTSETQFARQVWREISDPKALAGRNKLYCIEKLDDLWNSAAMARSVPMEGRLPANLRNGSMVQRMLPVTDDLVALEEQIGALRLRLCFSELHRDDDVTVTLNGNVLDPSRENSRWLAAEVPAPAVRQGDNVLGIRFESGNSDSLTIESAELAVRYE